MSVKSPSNSLWPWNSWKSTHSQGSLPFKRFYSPSPSLKLLFSAKVLVQWKEPCAVMKAKRVGQSSPKVGGSSFCKKCAKTERNGEFTECRMGPWEQEIVLSRKWPEVEKLTSRKHMSWNAIAAIETIQKAFTDNHLLVEKSWWSYKNINSSR